MMNSRDGDETLEDMQRINFHDEFVQERAGWSHRAKRRIKYASLVATLVLVITLSVTLSGNKGNSSSSSASTDGPRVPKSEVDQPALETNTNELGGFLVSVYQQLGITDTPWTVEGSPQYLALHWISGRDEYTSYEGTQRIQRYALACVYYATFLKSHLFIDAPTDWTSQNNWLSDEPECTWEGITCHSNNVITAIRLPDNGLSGSLPIELALLSHMEDIDVSSNFIYLEGDMHAFWKHLIHMKTINLEDNFIVTTNGLPTEFGSLSKLLHLQLSYNLLQGELTDDVFTGMPQLQHLEFESNYITGDFPQSLGLLTDLQFIYARSNELSIALDTMMATGNYPNLFSFWIDNNEVTTTIPTEIGQIIGLASLSMTNTTVPGPIPTELGLLTDLQRVWLYNNQLSGSIPSELNQLSNLEVFEIQNNALNGTVPVNICSSVGASTYELRSLVADCDRVTCDSCCTKCFPN
jgi:hypothetical protein